MIDARPGITLRRGRRANGTFAADMVFLAEVQAELGLSGPQVARVMARAVKVVQDWARGRARIPATCRRRLMELVVWKRTGVRPWWSDPLGLVGGD